MQSTPEGGTQLIRVGCRPNHKVDSVRSCCQLISVTTAAEVTKFGSLPLLATPSVSGQTALPDIFGISSVGRFLPPVRLGKYC